MYMKNTGRGFTISELIASMGVIAVLAAILFPVFAGARDSARIVRCTANLHQIAVAAQVYYQDHYGPPMTPLPASLGPYVDSSGVFVCPADHASTDSYSAFFVGRHSPATATEFVVGCPRHNNGRKAAAICGKAKSEVGLAGEVKHNGDTIHLGEPVEGGVLTFADGSEVSIQDGLSVVVLTSVSTDQGLHSVVWVSEGNEGCLEATVTPGSRFEVCTPEIVAAVRGTRFRVTVYKDYEACGHPASHVIVYEGEVAVEARLQSGEVVLRADDAVLVKSTLAAETVAEDEGDQTSEADGDDDSRDNNGNAYGRGHGPGPWRLDKWTEWWAKWWDRWF